MADFRKWFLAFAVTALLCTMVIPANAQSIPQALACTANAGNPPTVRAEGLTELVGDVVLRCTGGEPTAPGAIVPSANISISLSTNITSKITATPDWTEALLLVDEPHSAINPTVPLRVCGDTTTGETAAGTGVCTLLGAPVAAGGLPGIGTYNGNNTSGNGGNYRPNVFQGRRTADNQITFFGVPVDPPGTGTVRSYRITNVRANASQLGVSSTLVPSQITMYISVTGSLPIQNPQITVAYVQVGLTVSNGTKSFVQCEGQFPGLYAGTPEDTITPQFAVTFKEGFPASWKEDNIATHLANVGAITATAPISI